MRKISDIVMQSENNTLISRLNTFKSKNNNELGSQMKQFGSTLAFQVPRISGTAFNTVRNINEEDYIYLNEIVDWYKQQNMDFQIEVAPQNASKELFHELRKHEFIQTGFHASFIGDVKEIANSSCQINCEIQFLQKEDFNDFADVYVKGYGLPEFIADGVKENNESLYEIEGWQFFKAVKDDKMIGIAVLFIKDDIATLAAATTLPEYRGQGIQKGLIKARGQYAFKQGALYMTSEAKFESTSHANMVKSKMDLVYTKAIYNKYN
ncbi:GNAT family N-acetyltransferase [Viridibacillus sp. FSL R5-0477]|uniref:GNAT family acetyltransferase n=1 Tax=Viridibacillus arenosi FSL R5-213 TaxID=1227360 RepID=W4EWM0_9BACL|nr:GNAT family N-acetyltransferase [Viridibacillus arenosi]ETT84241.1 GNAT family acetyltransferase [Viridibacillus arenosi FSL R5-213]OMC89966.1 N-acetyltransferase [Viridibacillus arenosi]